MKKNVGSQIVGVQMTSATDGSDFTGTVTCEVTKDGGVKTASGGTGPTDEGEGFYTYIPTQAETNADHIAFTFAGTGAISATVQVYTHYPQTVDNNVLAAGATGFAAIDTNVQQSRAKYQDGAVWIGPSANTNTVSYVDGITTNPVSTLAAAKTIADALGLRRFFTTRTGTTQLAADMVGYGFGGDFWSLTTTGGSRDVSASRFENANVIGGTFASTSASSQWRTCVFDTGVSVAESNMNTCGFKGTITLNAAGDYNFVDCASLIAGASAPVFAVPAGTVNLSFRRWSGGIRITGITATTTISIDMVSGGTVTLEGAEGSVNVRGMATSVDDQRTGSPTLVTTAMVNVTTCGTATGFLPNTEDGSSFTALPDVTLADGVTHGGTTAVYQGKELTIAATDANPAVSFQGFGGSFAFDCSTVNGTAVRFNASGAGTGFYVGSATGRAMTISGTAEGLQIVSSGGKDIASVTIEAILADSNELQTNQGNWLTATGFNTTTPPTVAAIADGVWVEAIADHSGTAGSTAESLNAAGGAGDPWITAIPGAYSAGQAGYIVGTNLDAQVSAAGGGGTTIIGGSYTRNASTSFYARTNEQYTTPAFQLINPATGAVVDPSTVTLEVFIETSDKVDVETIADGALTKVSGASGTVQFTSAAATNASEAPKRWSIRDTTTAVVYREGPWNVTYSPE